MDNGLAQPLGLIIGFRPFELLHIKRLPFFIYTPIRISYLACCGLFLFRYAVI
jgi:hypothetical protein